MSHQKSTRELKIEVLEICGELTDGTSPFDALAVSYLNKVYRGLIAGNNLFDISCDEPWVWAQSKYPIILTLKAAVTGSAAMVNASTSGVFSSAPSISLEGRYIKFEGQADIYRITQHTAASTAFQIDQGFLGGSGSLNYSANQYDYDAINDVIVISSKNNKIDFTEGGSQLTATLTPGSYSPTALCTEIDSKMTAAGAQSYTVTFNSITRKFTIAQGGATFSLLFESGTNAALSASSVLGFDIEDLSDVLSYSSTYALSAIARLSKPISIYKGSAYYNENSRDANKIFMVDDNTFLRDYPFSRFTAAIPDKFAAVEKNPDGLWVLRFNGAPTEDTRAELNIIPPARALMDSENSFPLLPGDSTDFLVNGAAHYIQTDKSDSKAQDSLAKAQANLKALIAHNRQGSQLAGQNFGKMIARPSGLKRQWGTGSAY